MLAYGKQGTWWSFHPLANLPADGTALYKVFTGQDAYLLNGHHPEFGGAWGVAAIACWAVLVLAVVRGVRMGGWRLSRPSTLALVLTFSLYSAFFTIWTPGYFVFWLTQGAMIMGLGAAGSPETFRDIRWRRAAIIAVAVLGLVTYTDAIRPKTVAATNRHLRMAEHLRPLGSPANLMVLSGMGWMAEDEVYVPYFAHLPVIALHAQWDRAGRDPALATEAIRGYINATLAAGGHAYLLGEAVDSPYSLLDMRERYGVTPETIRGVFSPYHMVPVDRYDNVTIYELRLKRKTTTTQTVNDLR